MAYLIPNSTSSWELSDEEVMQGSMFTETQMHVLQNHLASLVEEKLALEVDPNNYAAYLQQEAYKRGQIETMQYLMSNSDAIKEELEFRARQEIPPTE